MDKPESRTTAAPQSAQDSLDLSRLRHDLRTPINHIIGYCEMLMEDGGLPGAFMADLKRIHAGGRQLQSLILQYFQEDTFLNARNLHQLYHELRTPVNHVVGYSELLRDQAEDQGLHEAVTDLDRIREAAVSWLELMEAYLVDPALAGQGSQAAVASLGLGFQLPEPDSARIGFKDEGAVLVVDDDEGNREMLARRLRRYGYTVSAAPNGMRALSMVRAQKFDLVLLDLIMAGLDGFQVLAKLKADPVLKDLPVIMLSALDQENGIARCIEMGAEDYIPKPFNPVFLRARIGAAIEKKRLRDREASYLAQIQKEKQRSDELLHIILPPDVATELKATNSVQPRRFENTGVLFCDIVGFTAYCDQHPPEEILQNLQQVVRGFEQVITKHGLEKIKTIGDSFMATAGLRTAVSDPARRCVDCGLEMIAVAAQTPPHWQVRVGVNLGPVIAGVVGNRKYQYDVWGDTVNLAARLETAAAPGSVCVTLETYRGLVASSYRHSLMGQIQIKGKGQMDLVRIDGPGT